MSAKSRTGTEAARWGRKGTPSRSCCLFCLLLVANSSLDLRAANLSSAVIHFQELTVHFSRVKAGARWGVCPLGMDSLSCTTSNERGTSLQLPWPASFVWATLQLSLIFFLIVFICFVLFVLFCFVYLFVLDGKHPCTTRKPWYKHNLNGERFCPGGTTPRLSEVLLRRQIKPIRKPLEPRAVFGLLFPPWDISFYCFSHFLWVSVGPLGGAATAGKGSAEPSCPRGHMGSLVLFLAQTPSVSFRHTSARKVGPRW